MKKFLIAGFAVAALAVGSMSAAALTSPQEASAPQQMQIASFAIENMTCALCPVTVRNAMEGVDGVTKVTVDFEAKTATAKFDPSKTTTSAIAAASTNAGYPAKPVKKAK